MLSSQYETIVTCPHCGREILVIEKIINNEYLEITACECGYSSSRVLPRED